MGFIVTGDLLQLLMPFIGGALITLLHRLVKSRQEQADWLFRDGVELAYKMVDNVAKRTENKIDDKVALGLKFLNEWLNVHGKADMTALEEEKAKMLFNSMHGEGK